MVKKCSHRAAAVLGPSRFFDPSIFWPSSDARRGPYTKTDLQNLRAPSSSCLPIPPAPERTQPQERRQNDPGQNDGSKPPVRPSIVPGSTFPAFFCPADESSRALWHQRKKAPCSLQRAFLESYPARTLETAPDVGYLTLAIEGTAQDTALPIKTPSDLSCLLRASLCEADRLEIAKAITTPIKST